MIELKEILNKNIVIYNDVVTLKYIDLKNFKFNVKKIKYLNPIIDLENDIYLFNNGIATMKYHYDKNKGFFLKSRFIEYDTYKCYKINNSFLKKRTRKLFM